MNREDESDMQNSDIQARSTATAPEDQHPLDYVGEEASSPNDTGRGADPADQNPPGGVTPENEDPEDASASIDDEALSEEGQEQ